MKQLQAFLLAVLLAAACATPAVQAQTAAAVTPTKTTPGSTAVAPATPEKASAAAATKATPPPPPATNGAAVPKANTTGTTAPPPKTTPAAAAAATVKVSEAPSTPKGPTNMLRHNGKDIFLTGVNLGNVQFLPFEGNPYGYTPDQMCSVLATAFADIAATGANSFRFWLHIDGSRSPSWGMQGGNVKVTGLPASLLPDLKWFLRTAYEQYGLLTCISLWSHDILAVRRENSVGNRARALQMMTDDASTDAYINNALLPMIEGLREPMRPGGPTYLDAVISWDVLNEPEGVSRHWRLYKNYMYAMRYGNYTWWNPNTYALLRQKSSSAKLTNTGGEYNGWYFYQEDGTFNNFMYHDVFDNYPSEWDFLKESIVDKGELTTVEVPYTKVLRFINKLAGAIHRADPNAKVTVGAHSTPYITNIAMPNLWYDNAPMNYYTDADLVAAGGDPLGTLDFYAVHGYAIWDENERDSMINMFIHPKSHWGTDKPILVGEHWEQVMPYPSTVNVDNYVHLYDSGYAGGWGWAWFNVTERFDYATGAASRGIGEHKCRGTLRSLLSGLPTRMKHSARSQQQAPATQPAVPETAATAATATAATAAAAATATAATATAATATAIAAPASGVLANGVPAAAPPATAPVPVATITRPVTVSIPAVTG